MRCKDCNYELGVQQGQWFCPNCEEFKWGKEYPPTKEESMGKATVISNYNTRPFCQAIVVINDVPKEDAVRVAKELDNDMLKMFGNPTTGTSQQTEKAPSGGSNKSTNDNEFTGVIVKEPRTRGYWTNFTFKDDCSGEEITVGFKGQSANKVMGLRIGDQVRLSGILFVQRTANGSFQTLRNPMLL